MLAGGLASAPAAQAEQVLVTVTPGNGESVRATPEEAVLTFSEPLGSATVTVAVRTPDATTDVTPLVSGRTVTVPITDAGPGEYVVDYAVQPGTAHGQTGFTVLAAGQSAPEPPASSPWWLVAMLVAVGGLALAVGATVRRWRQG